MRVTLNGTLTADGGETCACGFEWGLTAAYGNTTSTQSKVTGESFSYVLNDMTVAGTYHYRAFATNSTGTSYGADVTFVIPASVLPVVATLEAEDVSDSSANLKGYVQQDNGYPCSLWFEWGADQSYGHRTEPQYYSAPHSFEQLIGGLHPEAAYHFRAVAQNRNGIGYGADKTFITTTPLGPITSIGVDGALLMLAEF